MNWLNNIKISRRLFAGFSAAILSLVIILIIVFSSLSSIKYSIDDVATDKFVKTVWANQLLSRIASTAQLTRNIIISDDSVFVEKQLAEMAENQKQNTIVLDSLRARIVDEKGKELIARMLDVRVNVYTPVRKRLFDYLNKKDKENARALLFGEMKTVTDLYVGSIENLITYVSEDVSHTANEAGNMVSASMTKLTIIGSLF